MIEQATPASHGGGSPSHANASAKWFNIPRKSTAEALKAHATLARIFARHISQIVRYGLIDGLPGLVTVEGDGIFQTTALQITDGKIPAIYVVHNPDKLWHHR